MNQSISEELMEELAAIEHTRLANWQKWCHQVFKDGKFEEFMPRWERQIATPYSELSEEEKESDRREVRSYLPLLESKISKALTAERKELREKVEGMKTYTGGSSVNEKDKRVNKQEVLSFLEEK